MIFVEGDFYWIKAKPTIEIPEPNWEIMRAAKQKRFGFISFQWVFVDTFENVAWLDDIAEIREIEKPNDT